MSDRLVDDGSAVVVVPVPVPFVAPKTQTQVYPLAPGSFALGVYRGDTYEWVFQLLAQDGFPINVGGWRFKAEIRDRVDGSLMASLQEMSRDDVNGSVTMRLTSAQSRRVGGSGVWDLEVVTVDGWVKTVLRGNVEYLGDVTTGDVSYAKGVF